MNNQAIQLFSSSYWLQFHGCFLFVPYHLLGKKVCCGILGCSFFFSFSLDIFKTNYFTMLHWFVNYNNANQPLLYIHPLLPSLPPLPSSHPSRLSQGTRQGCLCFTPASHQLSRCKPGSVYMLMLHKMIREGRKSVALIP